MFAFQKYSLTLLIVVGFAVVKCIEVQANDEIQANGISVLPQLPQHDFHMDSMPAGISISPGFGVSGGPAGFHGRVPSGGRGGPHGGLVGSQGIHGAPNMQFMKNLNNESLFEFMAIVKNQALTKKDMDTQLQQWANKQSPEIQAAFMNATIEAKNYLKKISQKMQQDLSVDTDALTAFNSIQSIKNNMNLTPKEECEQIVQAVSALPQATRQKLHLPTPPVGASVTPAQICANNQMNSDGPGSLGGIPNAKHAEFMKQIKNNPAVGKIVHESAEEVAAQASS